MDKVLTKHRSVKASRPAQVLHLGGQTGQEATLSSKSWSHFDHDPTVWKLDDGTQLGQIEKISVALVRVNIPTVPYFDLRWTINFSKRSLGSKTTDHGARMIVNFLDSNGVAIYVTDIPLTSLPATEFEAQIRCNDAGTPVSYTYGIDTDIYDDIQSVRLDFEGGYWYRCG